jgi:hypothetical protein
MKTILGHLTILAGALAIGAVVMTSALADGDAQAPAGQGMGSGVSGIKGAPGGKSSTSTSTFGQSAAPPVSKSGPSGPEENRSVGGENKVPEGRDNAGGKPTSVSRLVRNKKGPDQVTEVSRDRGSPNMPGGIGTGSKRVGAKDKAHGDDK